MANTTNLNLVKPAGTDKALVSVLNANSDKIDAFAGSTNQALANKLDKSASVISSLSNLKTWYSTNKIGVVRVTNTVGVLLSGRSRQGMVSGYEIASDYIGYTFLDSNGDVYSGYITTATDVITYNKLAHDNNNMVVNTTLINVEIPDGSTSSYSTIELDCTSVIPSGYEVYGATIAVQNGSSWYTLPWYNNGLTQTLRIIRLTGKKIYLGNASTGWGTTNLSVSLFLKKNS